MAEYFEDVEVFLDACNIYMKSEEVRRVKAIECALRQTQNNFYYMFCDSVLKTL